MAGERSNGLLERAHELREIESLLARTRAGQGGLLFVEGGPGLGKSSLLTAAQGEARAEGLRALTTKGSALEMDVPFVLAERLLAPLRPAGPPEGVGEGSDLAVIRELERAVLEATAGTGPDADDVHPIALLVDDVQWADGASLRFLLHLALGLEGLPIAMIVTHRPEEEVPELVAALRVEAGERVLRPAPLGPGALGELADALLGEERDGMAAALAEVTGGVPFYAVELLREVRNLGLEPVAASIEDVAPERVLQALLGRLGRCGEDSAALAKALAILGDDAPLRLVASLADLDRDVAVRAADRLVQADILASDSALRFAHPLIRASLLADIGPFERGRLHERAASLLEKHDERDERIAIHYLRTEPAGAAGVVATLRSAAASARANGEPETSVRLLSRALEEPPPEAELAAVLSELAEAEATAGLPGAVEHSKAALAAIDSPQRRAETCVSLARTQHIRAEFEAAAQTAERGLRELSPGDPLHERLLAVWLDAAILCPPLHADIPARMEPLLAALRAGEVPSDPALRVRLANALGGEDAPREEILRLLDGVFEDPLVDGDPQGSALGFAANLLVYLDALEEAAAMLDAAVAAAERSGAVLALSVARHFRAHVHHHNGRLSDAVLDGEHALEVYRFGWTGWAWSKPILTVSELERGDLERAAELAAIADSTTDDEANHALVLEARARLRLAQGDPAGALADARAAGEISEGRFGVKSSRQFEWVRLAALAARAAGEAEAAAEYAEESLRRARAGAVPRQLGLALMTSGLTAGGAEGIRLLEEAREALASSPSRMARAHAELELGSALRRAGKRTEAKEALLTALEAATEFDAAAIGQRAKGELATLGLRPRRGARTGLGALTPGERRVFDLAAAGLSTPEIAHSLVVSRRTVENHLYRIYRKLGVSSRRELAAVSPE